jgi:hypothetical protein
MKKIIYLILSSMLIISCSKGSSNDIPEPYCEEGGTEVQMKKEEN